MGKYKFSQSPFAIFFIVGFLDEFSEVQRCKISASNITRIFLDFVEF